MSLKEILEGNWDKSSFMKISLNENIRTQIENDTQFLNSYYVKIPLRTRAYVIINSIDSTSIPKCKCGCGKPCAINISYPNNGFREYSGPECSRKSKTISLDSKSKLENYDWVYNQRITQQKSIELIAQELNISTIPVVKYLKKHNLHDLMDARSRNRYSTKILRNKNELQKLYDSGLTCEKIAEQLGSSKATVSNWLAVHQIDTRPPNSYERKIKRISKEENTLYEYIKGIYSEDIIQSNRSVLNGKELDIYLPNHNLAIEYNGLYSHLYRPHESNESLIKGKSYHLKKTLGCSEKGIQLLQFYSDEWLFKTDIVKSIISSKLNLNQKIYARKCEKVILSTHEKNEFLNQNHIQGEDKSKIKLGLKYDDELVCVMTFCKSRFNNNYEWELSRFSNKIGLNVIGGFSKLLKWFQSEYSGNIVSYADRRYSNGNVYSKNKFEVIRINSPSYYYVDKNCMKRYNRMMFQKKLIGAYDCTEYEKAKEMGFNKIYDCGTICYGLNF